VVAFGVGEFFHRDNFSFHFADSRCDLLPGLLSRDALIFVAIEDRVPILALWLVARGIVVSPEDVEQVLVPNDFGIIIERDRLGVIDQIVIGWRFLVATTVARPDAEDSIETPKLGVRSPESSNSVGRSFKFSFRCLAIESQRCGGNHAIFDRQRNYILFSRTR
jgi:hypothetical protein